MLDIIQRNWNNPSTKIKQVDPAVSDEGRQRQIPGQGFASQAADNDLFVGGGHRRTGIVAWKQPAQRKIHSPGSQYANVVLDLRFVPTRQYLDKHLIRLSLHALLGRV